MNGDEGGTVRVGEEERSVVEIEFIAYRARSPTLAAFLRRQKTVYVSEEGAYMTKLN